MRITDTIKVETYEKNSSLLVLNSGEMGLPFQWAVGSFASKISDEIRDNRQLTGVKCLECGKVYFPPRRVCGPCFKPMTETVKLGSEGTIKSYCVVKYTIIDPDSSKARPIPYTYGYIKLDGADTSLGHFINEVDESKLSVGMRVRAVFKDKRTGNIRDIKHFEIV